MFAFENIKAAITGFKTFGAKYSLAIRVYTKLPAHGVNRGWNDP